MGKFGTKKKNKKIEHMNACELMMTLHTSNNKEVIEEDKLQAACMFRLLDYAYTFLNNAKKANADITLISFAKNLINVTKKHMEEHKYSKEEVKEYYSIAKKAIKYTDWEQNVMNEYYNIIVEHLEKYISEYKKESKSEIPVSESTEETSFESLHNTLTNVEVDDEDLFVIEGLDDVTDATKMPENLDDDNNEDEDTIEGLDEPAQVNTHEAIAKLSGETGVVSRYLLTGNVCKYKPMYHRAVDGHIACDARTQFYDFVELPIESIECHMPMYNGRRRKIVKCDKCFPNG